MKATILAEHPFLIPFGTKVRLVPDNDNTPAVECFFAGYKAYDNTIIDKFCFFPRFKKPRKDGGMGTRNIYYCFGVFGYSDLEKYSIEILDLPDDYDMRDPASDKYNDLVSGLVAVCTREMFATARRKGISELRFEDHPAVDKPFATFDADDPVTGETMNAHLPVSSIEIFDDEILIHAEDGRFMGYLDSQYGDGFDVAQSLPHIYKAFVEAVGSVEN